MDLTDALQIVIIPGLRLLPPYMDTPAARAMLLTIGLQESRFKYRKQVGGPAKGFFQFEEFGGVAGVLRHSQTKGIIHGIMHRLQYTPDVSVGYEAIEHNDILAVVFARLLMWTLPTRLPTPTEYNKSWEQYLAAWRPGKPHRETWDAFYREAWGAVTSMPAMEG